MKILIFFLTILMIAIGCRKSDYIIDESDIVFTDFGQGTGTVTWTSDKNYTLSGFVFVNEGQVLTIEPGTVIRFKSGQGALASALIIARGGKIIANGTAEKPIIFTAESDELNGNLSFSEKGLWGGLIILGNATLNNFTNESQIEGIPISEFRGLFGGTNDDDNSGSLTYISIRHAGSILGQGNEINGLTLGGVGRGTNINHVEIVSCADDGIEIFGGTADIKYLASVFCDDDAIDTDLGYRGRMQYVFSIKDSLNGDLNAEHGGGVNPVLGVPNSKPIILNATYIGCGNLDNNSLISFKNNSAGIYANSIFLNQKHGVSLEFVDGSSSSFSQWQDGDLEIKNNIFYNIGSDTSSTAFLTFGDFPGTIALQFWHNYFYDGPNEFMDPGIIVNPNFIKPQPVNDVSLELFVSPDPFFDRVNYKGAFGGINWLVGWSLIESSGYIQ
jgi:hypothetical protein